MFLFKKIVAPFFLPTTLIFIFLLLGIWFLWFSRKEKIGKILVTISFALFTLFSYNIITNSLLKGLESNYPPLVAMPDASVVPWVVVLAGGVSVDKELPANDQLTSLSLLRLIEGIRIYRQMPGSRLLLSGGSGSDTVTEAALMAETALSLGVKRQDLYLEKNSLDSKDQAREVKYIVGNERFILVSSAAHMPRLMALFKKQGLTPIPAPTNSWMSKRQKIKPRDFFPSASLLHKTDRAIHEHLGLIWARLMGQA